MLKAGSFTRLAFAVALFAAGCTSTYNYQGTPPLHFNSGNSSELVSTLPIFKTSDWHNSQVVFSVKLTGLKKGDILSAMSEMEVTNDAGYNTAIVGQIILSESPAGLPAGGVTKYDITEGNGFNVTLDMHHGLMTKVGTLECPKDLPEMYVNLCAFAASTAARPGDVLKVEKDYGRLSVLVYKK